MTGYLARSRTASVTGDDTSHRANMNYSSDRYAVQVDRTVVGPRFIPDVGFLPRQNFERSYASARFGPRPSKSPIIRKYYFDASLNYVTDDQQRLESRQRVSRSDFDQASVSRH